MSEQTQLEELEEAIAHLEKLTQAATAGRWELEEAEGDLTGNIVAPDHQPWVTPLGNTVPHTLIKAEGNWTDGYFYDLADAELLITLHAAAPVLLSILNTARDCADENGRLTGSQQGRDGYELAQAILTTRWTAA